jgi:hypothetical protein
LNYERPRRVHLGRCHGLRFEIIRNGGVAEAQIRGICVAMDAIQFIERGVLDHGTDSTAGYFRQSALKSTVPSLKNTCVTVPPSVCISS